jgi:hypothetical protein
MSKQYPIYNDSNLGGSTMMRMKLQGYTTKELRQFKYACYMGDDKLMEAVKCRCKYLPTKCEVCRFKEMVNMYNPSRTNRKLWRTRLKEY